MKADAFQDLERAARAALLDSELPSTESMVALEKAIERIDELRDAEVARAGAVDLAVLEDFRDEFNRKKARR